MQSCCLDTNTLSGLLKPNRAHAVIRRSLALARRLEGWPRTLVVDPSRLAEVGEHLRMTTRVVDTVSFGRMAGMPRRGRQG